MAATVVFGGCGTSTQAELLDEQHAAADSALGERPVSLASAQAVAKLGSMMYPAWLKGTLRVANLGYQKQVWVVYQVRSNQGVVQDWTRVEARWAKGDLWDFETPVYQGECPHYCSELAFRFALAYSVNGQTYWDNNGGWNYGVSVDVPPVPGSTETPPGIFGDVPLQLSHSSWSGDGWWSGEVLVSNVGGVNKRVTLLYSTDNWRTVREAAVDYNRQSYWTAFEHWRFSFVLSSTSNEVQYALKLENGQQVFWDNNLGRNYTQRR